jgi:hypothetical protein
VDGKSGVFRIAEGRARFVPVVAGSEVQGQVEITSGLQGGEKLVAAPAAVKLKENDRVRVDAEPGA